MHCIKANDQELYDYFWFVHVLFCELYHSPEDSRVPKRVLLVR